MIDGHDTVLVNTEEVLENATLQMLGSSLASFTSRRIERSTWKKTSPTVARTRNGKEQQRFLR